MVAKNDRAVCPAVGIGLEHDLAWELVTQRDRHLQVVLDGVGAHVLIDHRANHPTRVLHRSQWSICNHPSQAKQIRDAAHLDGVQDPGSQTRFTRGIPATM